MQYGVTLVSFGDYFRFAVKVCRYLINDFAGVHLKRANFHWYVGKRRVALGFKLGFFYNLECNGVAVPLNNRNIPFLIVTKTFVGPISFRGFLRLNDGIPIRNRACANDLSKFHTLIGIIHGVVHNGEVVGDSHLYQIGVFREIIQFKGIMGFLLFAVEELVTSQSSVIFDYFNDVARGTFEESENDV